MTHRRAGMALPLVLVLLLALTALGHGTLLLAQREVSASAGYRRLVQARRLAEGGSAVARRRLEAMPGSGAPDSAVVLVDAALPAGGWYRGRVVPLSPELLLVEGRGGVGAGWGEARVGWLGWRLDPAARVAAQAGVVVVGVDAGSVDPSPIESSDLRRIPEGWDHGACASWTSAADTLFPLGYLAPVAPADPGPPDSGPGSAVPSLGLLTGTRLLESGDPLSGSSLASGPGCPGQPGEGVLHAEEGSVTLRGGGRCGVLVVAGDLRLTDGHRFQGLLLVGGDLEVDSGAILEGMARIGGALRIRDGARVVGSACAVLRSLGETLVLQGLLPLPEGSILRPF